MNQHLSIAHCAHYSSEYVDTKLGICCLENLLRKERVVLFKNAGHLITQSKDKKDKCDG